MLITCERGGSYHPGNHLTPLRDAEETSTFDWAARSRFFFLLYPHDLFLFFIFFSGVGRAPEKLCVKEQKEISFWHGATMGIKKGVLFSCW